MEEKREGRRKIKEVRGRREKKGRLFKESGSRRKK